ncbi:MAG: hypothetical protein KDJ97_24075 [Anaerolineae bacterium]|nr:hypothetical protein [Anaerolineae bacterium]
MRQTKGKGVFIFGDEPESAVPVTWELTGGETLRHYSYWRADILIDVTNEPTRWEIDAEILEAIKQEFRFRLKTEDGAIFPCSIYSIDDFNEYGVGIYPLEIWSGPSKVYIR